MSPQLPKPKVSFQILFPVVDTKQVQNRLSVSSIGKIYI